MRISEIVNTSVFRRGFSKEKTILDGKVKLVAKPGYIAFNPEKKLNTSQQFRIEAFAGKNMIAWVNFEAHGEALEALDLSVDESYRRKGIASQMYAFAKELGNSISPSKMQTELGKKFWNKDHR